MAERRWSLRWEPRDLWVGLYWDRKADGLHWYVCLVPCVVLHVRPRRHAFQDMTEPEDPRFSFRVGTSAGTAEFDDLVVGSSSPWIHLECMGSHDELPDGSEDPNGAMCWWARIGDAHLWVSVPRDGEPTLDVQRGYYGDVKGRTTVTGPDGHELEVPHG